MTTAAYKIKVSDLSPTTLRLQPDLLDRLKREAAINNRSLSQEAEYRLRHSFHYAAAPAAGPVPTDEVTGKLTEVSLAKAEQALTEAQRRLLSLFDAMSPERQLALLTVLKKN